MELLRENVSKMSEKRGEIKGKKGGGGEEEEVGKCSSAPTLRCGAEQRESLKALGPLPQSILEIGK